MTVVFLFVILLSNFSGGVCDSGVPFVILLSNFSGGVCDSGVSLCDPVGAVSALCHTGG